MPAQVKHVLRFLLLPAFLAGEQNGLHSGGARGVRVAHPGQHVRNHGDVLELAQIETGDDEAAVHHAVLDAFQGAGGVQQLSAGKNLAGESAVGGLAELVEKLGVQTSFDGARRLEQVELDFLCGGGARGGYAEGTDEHCGQLADVHVYLL